MADERPWVLGDTTWKTVRDMHYEVAILPWGATEAHNLHLPYGTDTIESSWVAHEAARLAWEDGARVVVLPAMPFGVNTGQLDIPLCLNLNPSTQAAVLRDVVDSVERAGVAKLVILNGHGGNDFRQIIRELQPDTDVFLCTLNWYACVDAKAHFADPGDHAGELETSVMQHIAPDLVRAALRCRRRQRTPVPHPCAPRRMGMGATPMDPGHRRHRRREPACCHAGEGLAIPGRRRRADCGVPG